MKERLIKTVMRESIGRSRACAQFQDIQITADTLPLVLPQITKLRKKKFYVIAMTPGDCYHCGKVDDIRFGVCDACSAETYTDELWVWHASAPDRKWAIPTVDRVLGRV